MTDEITTIADDYLAAREETNSNDSDVDELREKRDEWESKMDGLDEDDPLYDIATENFESYQQKIETIEESRGSLNEHRETLLEAAADRFIPRDEWINEEVLRALNLSLLDEDRKYIEIGTNSIEPNSPVNSDEEVFEVAPIVRTVAEEELGESTELQQYWTEFGDRAQFQYFTEIASAGEPLTGKDIAMRLDEEDRRQAISQALIDTTKGKVNPYFKEGRGEYSLSFVGEYLLRRYGDELAKTEGGADKDVEESSESTATLENFD